MIRPLSRLAAGAALLAAGIAQAYPDRPITMVAQQPPGSGSDAMTRIWADCAAQKLGQPVVVQNKPGANGLLAVNFLKGSAADGYTLMTIGMSQMTITPYVYKTAPYDPNADFRHIAAFGDALFILAASPDSGIRTLDDLKNAASKRAGGIDFGSPGKGSPAHLLTTALTESLGVPATHVPFVGESAGVTAMIGNQIQIMTLVISTALPQIATGKLVPLALFSRERSPLLPDVPSIAELTGSDELARPGWIGVVAPPGIPAEAASRLEAATRACVDDAQFRQHLEAMKLTPAFSDGAQMRARADADSAVWKPLIERLGLVQE